MSLFDLLKKQQQEKANRKDNKMNKQENKKGNKKSYVCYVYGQIYAEYLKSGKANIIKVTNLHAREWKKILGFLKKNEYIVDFELGNSLETACDVVIEGFNENKKIYEKYLKGIEKHMQEA